VFCSLSQHSLTVPSRKGAIGQEAFLPVLPDEKGDIMKKCIAYLCITIMALILFSGCARQQAASIHCCTRTEGTPEHDMTVLPFSDGTFILTPYDFDDGGFVFNSGTEVSLDRRNGIIHYIFYRAIDFHLHSRVFINIMNNFDPVLVDSITTERRIHTPFYGIESNNYLYSFIINNVPNWACTLEMDEFSNFHLRMRVYETNECGLLHFFMHGSKTVQRPASSHVYRSDIAHHSLYRITLDELSEFIQFAESLEKVNWWSSHGHLPPAQRLLAQLFIIAIIFAGIIVCVATVLIIRRHRKKKASASTTQDEEIDLS